MPSRPIIRVKIASTRQQFSHGRSKEAVVERRSIAEKQKPEKPKLVSPKPEKPTKKQKPKKKPKTKRHKRKRQKRPQGLERPSRAVEHLFKPSEPMGPRSIVGTQK